MKTVLERFLKYVSIETTSREDVERFPSSDGQLELANLLVVELKELGLADAEIDSCGYVFATLPARLPQSAAQSISEARSVPTVGWIAHLDTSCAASGKDVRPEIVEYQGGDVRLKNGRTIPEDDELRRSRGRRIVVSDGSTLLGADDKAGIAAIMTALSRLIEEDRPHGTIRIAFTPDEELGRGTDFFDVAKFNADFAYTVDGGSLGEINKETFTADKAILKIEGKEIHPGSAKGIMINAARILAAFVAELPRTRTPEETENREPFVHLYKSSGDVSFASAEFLLRAFDETERRVNREILTKTVEKIRRDWNPVSIEIEFVEQYLNMGEFLQKTPEVLDKLETAVRRAGVEPVWIPIRGGTDGSRLTEMGLPTPNLFTGGRNFHSPTEWLCVEDLEKTVETLVRLAEIWTEPR